jgi:hypothetical protein
MHHLTVSLRRLRQIVCRFFCSFYQLDLLSVSFVRRLLLILPLLIIGFSAAMAWGDAFKLTNGETLNGEVLPTSANDQGVQVKIGEGEYQRVPWANFSQDDLKNFAKNQRMQPFVEPFIEPNPEEKVKKTEVNIKQPPRLERPPRQSLFGAFFSSGLGVFVMLLLYGATIYAGFEVAIFRAQPPLLVCGLSAVPFLGILSPIVFLALRTNVKGTAPAVEAPTEAKPQPAAVTEQALNPMLDEKIAHPSGLKLAHTEEAKSTLPETITYQRGQFTFNRRFFETKFPGFFGVVRREAEKDMVLVIKSSRGEYTTQRISRIAANDLHVQVQRGVATEEVMVPFQEIKELRLKHKDA